jgi:hypothetical protein
MGDKIKRLSMNVAFKYICPKELNCLTNERMVYHLPGIKVYTFQFNWLRLWDQESGAMNKLKE